MIHTGTDDLRRGRLYEELGSGTWNVLGATFGDVSNASLSSGLARLAVPVGLDVANEDNPMLPPEVAAERARENHVELEIPDEGMTEAELSYLIKRHREHAKRQDVLRRNQNGVGVGTLQFATGMLAIASDPLELGLMFVPIVGSSRWANLTTRAAQISGVGMRTAARFGLGAAEGATGAILSEGVNWLATESEQIDYAASDFLFNVAAGTVLGGFIHSGGGVVADSWRARKARLYDQDVSAAAVSASQKIEVRDTALRSATAQLMEGRAVDVAPILRVGDSTMPGVARAATEIPAPAVEFPTMYRGTAILPGEDAATVAGGTDAGKLGIGRYYSGKETVARGYAVMAEQRRTDGATANVTAETPTIRRPLQVDVTGREHRAALDQLASDMNMTDRPEWSGGRQTNPYYAEELTARLQDQGYDGVILRDGDEIVEAVAFPDRPARGGHTPPDPVTLRNAVDELTANSTTPNSRIVPDEAEARALEADRAIGAQDESATLAQEISDLDLDMQARRNAGLLTDEDLADLAEAQRLLEEADQIGEAVDAAVFCRIGA